MTLWLLILWAMYGTKLIILIGSAPEYDARGYTTPYIIGRLIDTLIVFLPSSYFLFASIL